MHVTPLTDCHLHHTFRLETASKFPLFNAQRYKNLDQTMFGKPSPNTMQKL
jgi:hypothetical protein